MRQAFLFSILLVSLLACSGPESQPATATSNLNEPELLQRWQVVNTAIDSIREGDLLLRCGSDYTSYTLRDFSQTDKQYSHSGIVLADAGRLYVYHNMAGDLNPNEVMRRDPLDSFLSPTQNIAFGIYRYDMDSAEILRLREIVFTHYQNRLPFDMNFDLDSDDKMYCVEMIAKSINRATNKRIEFSRSMVNDFLRQKYMKMALQKKVIPSPKAADQREYLAIDNLYLNPHCRKVMHVQFEENRGLQSFPTPEIDSNRHE